MLYLNVQKLCFKHSLGILFQSVRPDQAYTEMKYEAQMLDMAIFPDSLSLCVKREQFLIG